MDVDLASDVTARESAVRAKFVRLELYRIRMLKSIPILWELPCKYLSFRETSVSMYEALREKTGSRDLIRARLVVSIGDIPHQKTRNCVHTHQHHRPYRIDRGRLSRE